MAAQEQLGIATGVERRRAPRITTNHIALCLTFGLVEGGLAALVIVVPALIYHVVSAGVVFLGAPMNFYAAYSLLVGAIYGVLSAMSASRFLCKARSQHMALTDSMLSWTAAFAAALFVSFLIGVSSDLSRIALTSSYLVGVPVLLGARSIAYSVLWARIRAGRLQYEKVGVIGGRGDVARFLFNGNLWRSGYQMVGALHLEEVHNENVAVSADLVVQAAQDWVDSGVKYIVFVGRFDDLDSLEWLTNALRRFAVNVVGAPASDNTSFKFLGVVPMGANNALQYLRKPMGDAAILLKRAFDLSGALFGLLLLSPLFAGVAVLIKLDGPGPVFYRQERRGFNGKTFFIWKFRSMSVTESGRQMEQARLGDRRITRIGRIIRATSIDELPQLINVAIGNMSLVGPRPHALMHDDDLGQQLTIYAHRQRIKPGITGWAQINGYRGETSTFEQIQGRTEHDLHYIDHWSIFLDCWIIVQTLFSKKARHNAF